MARLASGTEVGRSLWFEKNKYIKSVASQCWLNLLLILWQI